MKPLVIVKDSLRAAYNAVGHGDESMKKAYGPQRDITTRADMVAGRAILDILKKSEIPLAVYSEESERTETGTNPRYSAVFDDIDGTLNFRDGSGMLPHGSMMGIFESPNPRFSDCLASGFLEFNSGHLFYAERRNGAHVVKKWVAGENMEKQITTSGRKKIDGSPPLIIVPDMYMLGNLGPCFARYGERAWLSDFRSCATHMAMVASGTVDILITGDNCYNPKKRKTGEELGPGYLMVREAGGAVIDWKGNDIGNEEIGLDKRKPFHAVLAATEELGQEFVEDMRRMPEIEKYMKARKLI